MSKVILKNTNPLYYKVNTRKIPLRQFYIFTWVQHVQLNI